MRLKKLKLSKRKILTTVTVLVIFVMSLGYAALSQHMDIDGIATIDRNWIVKVTGVTSSVTNSGVDTSKTYVGTTVTMHANLPNSSSTVTYTITLENQGNLVAKLSSIEKIEDDNTNITYTISGVTEGTTLLNPGETNTITVTIKYASGVTSVSNTEKSLMLNINYVENTTTSITGGTLSTTNAEYKVGDYVTLVDGSKWYVVKDSGSDQELVTLFSEYSVNGSGYPASDATYTTYFDYNGDTLYNTKSYYNIGYFVENTVKSKMKTSLTSAGGNATGLTARLLTLKEYNNFVSVLGGIPDWIKSGTDFWTMSVSYGTNMAWYYTSSDYMYYLSATSSSYVRPVITVLKSNVKTIDLGVRIAQVNNIASADTSLDLSAISSSTNGQGLYYTTTNTQDSGKTYYFRGAVTNNYVKFGGYYWRVVRVNEDGSVRLIYQGTTATATGTSARTGTSAFNSYSNSRGYPAYVGYMYGRIGRYNEVPPTEYSLSSTTYSGFVSSTRYYFADSYTVDFSSGSAVYKLSGNTQVGTWSALQFLFSSTPYTCVKTSLSDTCTTLYKMDSYTNENSGTAYKVTAATPTSYSYGSTTFITAATSYTFDENSGTYTLSGTEWENQAGYLDTALSTYPYLYTCRTYSSTTTIPSCTTLYKIVGETSGTIKYYTYSRSSTNSYALTHANTNTSTIKTALDSWYKSNLASKASYLADAGFCNDRSLYSGTGYDLTTTSYFGAYGRRTNAAPQFKCTNSDDLFTKTNEAGNKKLTYPIGLITADEVMYAGGASSTNSSYYLYTGSAYWTMSPSYYSQSATTGNYYGSVYNFVVNSSGYFSNYGVASSYGLRPVINLKADISPSKLSGTGTSSNPYTIG